MPQPHNDPKQLSSLHILDIEGTSFFKLIINYYLKGNR